jgi:FtsH-binding integral membrane protein
MFPCRACREEATEKDVMSGAAHLRIVVALFVVGGILALAPYVASLFSEDVNLYPFGWVGGLASIALALWLARGSNIARNLLVVFSVLGLLFYGGLVLAVLKHSLAIAAVLAVFTALSGYCLWALMFSKGVRAELDKRAAE